MKKFVALLISGFLFASCGNSQESATEETTQEVDRVEMLKKEIMEVHDKTMKEMGTLKKLDQSLYEAAQAGTIEEDAAQNAINDVRAAHEDMMNWMRSFENPDEMDATEDEIVAYLQGQKEKVEQLGEYTTRSIERAQGLLNKQ